jgi:hypothetical protein
LAQRQIIFSALPNYIYLIKKFLKNRFIEKLFLERQTTADLEYRNYHYNRKLWLTQTQ